MKRFLVGVFLLVGCGCAPAGPPADLAGKWEGWAEPAIDTKVFLKLDLTQDKAAINGTYHTIKVGPMGEDSHDGKVDGVVVANTTKLKFQDPHFDMLEDVELDLKIEGNERILAAVVVPKGGGLSCKYMVKQPLKK